MADYHINIFYSEEDGGYIADIPDLVECSAFGATPGGCARGADAGEARVDRDGPGRGEAGSPAPLPASYLRGDRLARRPAIRPQQVEGRLGVRRVLGGVPASTRGP